ncbi:MAG: hypothetical protein AB8B64_23405 [Granulosicoccus sp.]
MIVIIKNSNFHTTNQSGTKFRYADCTNFEVDTANANPEGMKIIGILASDLLKHYASK